MIYFVWAIPYIFTSKKHAVVYEINDRETGETACYGSTCAKQKFGWSPPKNSVEVYSESKHQLDSLIPQLTRNNRIFKDREDVTKFLDKSKLRDKLFRTYINYSSTDFNNLINLIADGIYGARHAN